MEWEAQLQAARAAMLKPLGKGLHGAIAPSHAPAVHAVGERFAADAARPLIRPGNGKTGGAGRHAARIVLTRGVAGLDCPHRTAWCESRCYAGVIASRGAGGGFKGGHGVGPAYSYLAHHDADELAVRLIDEIRASRADVVRIHDAGDFVSEAHVWAYYKAAMSLPWVIFFGFTRAWRSDDRAMRGALRALSALPNVRLRASGDPDASPTGADVRECGLWGTAVVVTKGENRPAGAFTCLEQAGKAASCADCGACWRTRATVAFLEH